MTSSDLFLIVATISLVFTTAFLCGALYWLIRTLRVWQRMSEEAERNVHLLLDRFGAALHAVTSLKAVADIALQTLQAARAVYQKKSETKRRKKSDDS